MLVYHILHALPEKHKIDSGFFLFEAEQKAKKAKKDIIEQGNSQGLKMMTKVCAKKKLLKFLVVMTLPLRKEV